MPLGYRMGLLAMEKLGVKRSRNHELFVFSEMGVGHPQGCLQDGIMAATSATFGKGQLHKLYYGKVAATFYQPGKGAIRIALRSEFADKLAPHEFFKYRKQGMEPTDIPSEVAEDIIMIVRTAADEEIFSVEMKPDFQFTPVKGSFNKAKCEECGEYVFERYLRRKNGKLVCIPCSTYQKDEQLNYLPAIKTGD